MTNFDLVTQDPGTLDDLISAIVDDALEAEGCSMDLKLPGALQGLGKDDVCPGWREWLEQEAEDETVYLPAGLRIEKWKKRGEGDG